MRLGKNGPAPDDRVAEQLLNNVISWIQQQGLVAFFGQRGQKVPTPFNGCHVKIGHPVGTGEERRHPFAVIFDSKPLATLLFRFDADRRAAVYVETRWG